MRGVALGGSGSVQLHVTPGDGPAPPTVEAKRAMGAYSYHRVNPRIVTFFQGLKRLWLEGPKSKAERPISNNSELYLYIHRYA